jgi:phosphoglycerate dehydrogenase-like enzyme
MPADVICLRPEADFARAGAMPPSSFTVAYHAPDDPTVPELLRAARALVIPAVGPRIAPDLFERSALELIQVTGAGLDRLDRGSVSRLGIPVANVPGNIAVAEYAVTAALTLLRRLAWADAEIKNGNYVSFRARMLADNLPGLDGLRIGIVGFGVIGRAVAEGFYQLGSRIAFYDPAPPNAQSVAELAAESLSLDALLEASDVVTLHLPLLPATQGLIGARELARMKQDAVLIQAARGGIVDEAALAQSLTAGRLGGAAVDVYSTEPPTQDNPLLALRGEGAQRLLLTPHIAGVTRQSSAFLFRSAWRNVERVLVHYEPPLHRVY